MAEHCDVCGGMIAIGDWPICNGDPLAHAPMHNASNKPMEPEVDDMIDRNEVKTWTTIGEKVRYMDRNGIVPRDVSEKRPGRRIYFT